MSRDHRKLRVFHEAHQLTLAIYRETGRFPRDEWFGVRAQIRRASVSVPSNLVEGSARRSSREYVNFVNVARASAAEVAYLVVLSSELGYLSDDAAAHLGRMCNDLIPQLESLIQQLEALVRQERRTLKPRA